MRSGCVRLPRLVFFLIIFLKTDSLRPGQLPHCVYPGESRLELLQHCCSGTTRPTNVCDRPTCPLGSECGVLTLAPPLPGDHRLRRFGSLLSSPSAISCAALLLRLVYLFLFFHDQPVPSGNRYVIGYETGSIAASLASGHGYG